MMNIFYIDLKKYLDIIRRQKYENDIFLKYPRVCKHYFSHDNLQTT